MKLEINKSYSIAKIIELVKNKLDRDFDIDGNEKYESKNIYDIYISENENLNSNTILYVGKPVQIDENDNEIFPKEVLSNNFEFEYSCQNFQDVIDLAYSQKKDATLDELINCLNYYSENDTFLDLK